jgi:hypothetical protein
MEQESVKRRLHLSNALIDCNRVSLNETPRDVSVRLHKHRILCVDDDVLGTHMRRDPERTRLLNRCLSLSPRGYALRSLYV